MIQLFNYFRSSASFRVRIALHLKGLSFEETQINLLNGEQSSFEYQSINPQALVPTIKVNELSYHPMHHLIHRESLQPVKKQWKVYFEKNQILYLILQE